ncbi:radical SAM family heme chaperone HemW [Fodinicurvata sediminis]|uniref:radical SAM family heme chaperone HemW n=1 Tax=Fodinicurvata sediminis TaxID=1121832 RepID=UPI0003B722C0|nr:radical SAM family heme chaperone HemW [Fodinicurvata sediminis]
MSSRDSLPETGADDPGFGLYVHWPFCQSKCPYCDFNSHVRESIDQDRWRQALLRELEHFAKRTAGRRLTSVFFGGGTPSLMAPETVGALLDVLPRYWQLDSNLEVTLEANPTSTEAGKFAAYRTAGVNRLSLGVQSFDDNALAFLGRRHSAAEAREAIALARRHFPRFSFDLIYARPEQSLASWEAELKSALQEGTEHISLYQLTIEPNTVFHGDWRRGELELPPEDCQAQLYECTADILKPAGLEGYEISNYARPGAESRHNLVYWRHGDYVGIGPGAHGRLSFDGARYALRQHRAPEAWLESVESQGHATRAENALTLEERLTERLMMGLRLAAGINRATVEAEQGRSLEALVDPARLKALCEAGYLELTPQRLRALPAGRQRLDALLGYLLG